MSIGPIASNVPPFVHDKMPTRYYWTEVKVRQVAMRILATITAAIAVSAIGMGIALYNPGISFLGLGLGSFSASMFYFANSLIDYDDPDALAAIQRGAPLVPLKSLVAKHSWPNIFRFCLLNPGQFEQSFCSQAAQLRFCDVLSFWHEAQKGLSQAVEGRAYTIPSPILWKEKFDQETRIVSCLEIADQYNKNDLVGLKIVSKKQQQAIEGAVREKGVFDETVRQLQRQFDFETIHERQAMEKAKNSANDKFNSHPAHVAISQITTLEQTEIARLQESNKRKIEKAEESFKQFKDQLIVQCSNALSPEDRLEIAQQRAATDLTIRQIRQKEVSEIEHIRFEMQERRKAEQKLLNAAKAQLERSLQESDEKFRLSTLPKRRQMDALLQGAEDHFHKETAACDRVFHS